MTAAATPDPRIIELENELRDVHARAHAAEHRVGRLAQLVAVASEMHAAPDEGAVIDIIKETVANLVGCEHLAIYRAGAPEADLVLVDSIGVNALDFATLPVNVPGVAHAVRERTAQFHRPAAPSWSVRGRPITACLPLVRQGVVEGCVVLFELLVQKPALVPDDEVLLAFLALHAASALGRGAPTLRWPDPAA